jgi:Fe2+ or Zn2+ uptake regulation protein
MEEDGLTAAQRLREVGLRVTSSRIAVLESLAEGRHLEVDAIGRLARERLGSLSTQAVYDILRALVLAGLVRRIEPAGSPALFESRAGDNHHHVVCRACGTIGDVDCVRGRRPCLEPSDTHGFVIDEAEVTFWGLCPVCAASESDLSAPEEMTAVQVGRERKREKKEEEEVHA